jgi:hypothetical protein
VSGERRFVDAVLVSANGPALRIRVDPALRHIGATELEIKGLALAERHHFVDAPDGHVRRMLVVQFEGFLPSNNETYRYRLPEPITMGGETYGSWVFGYSLAVEIDEDPAAESGDTARFLAAHGLSLDDEQLMARYARIIEPDARRELLVFYHEPIRRLGHTLASLCEGGELCAAHASVAVELKARARRAFEIAPA